MIVTDKINQSYYLLGIVLDNIEQARIDATILDQVKEYLQSTRYLLDSVRERENND